jgi:hypothetical protein
MIRVRTSLLLPEWPATDQDLWQAANSTGGFLEPDGRAAHWKNKTRKGVVKRYSLWLGYLSSTDQLEPDKSPSQAPWRFSTIFSIVNSTMKLPVQVSTAMA